MRNNKKSEPKPFLGSTPKVKNDEITKTVSRESNTNILCKHTLGDESMIIQVV